jgi:hypothetical protein
MLRATFLSVSVPLLSRNGHCDSRPGTAVDSRGTVTVLLALSDVTVVIPFAI